MQIRFSKLAKLEFDDTIKYYENEQKGLGLTFKDNIRDSILRIKNHPTLYPIVSNEIRKCTLHKFPFNIFYTYNNESLLILAISHQHRKPDYWKD